MVSRLEVNFSFHLRKCRASYNNSVMHFLLDILEIGASSLRG